MNEPPGSLAEYNALKAEFHQALGEAITEWAEVEYVLEHLFGLVVGGHGHTSRLILDPVLAFSVRAQIIDAMVRDRLGTEKDQNVYWNSLNEYLRELAGDRNFIAHAPLISHHYPKEEGRPRRMGGWPMLTWPRGLLHEQRILPMGTDDLREIRADFKHARELCGALCEALKSAPRLYGKLLQPIVRRRPPRAERQEAKRREYQSRAKGRRV